VKFLVLGVDGLAFGSADDLPEAHWTYMDGWADALIARGPTMSVDGHHTGSVHVVELPTSAAAHRFAREEPFAMAGWYSTISVSPVVPAMDELDRKELRIRGDQGDDLTVLTRQLNRARKGEGERITDNTLIRVAIDLLLRDGANLQGTTEADLLRSALPD